VPGGGVGGGWAAEGEVGVVAAAGQRMGLIWTATMTGGC
jgi:hypothetical protein